MKLLAPMNLEQLHVIEAPEEMLAFTITVDDDTMRSYPQSFLFQRYTRELERRHTGEFIKLLGVNMHRSEKNRCTVFEFQHARLKLDKTLVDKDLTRVIGELNRCIGYEQGQVQRLQELYLDDLKKFERLRNIIAVLLAIIVAGLVVLG